MAVREVTGDNYQYEFTCKRCGSHSFKVVSASQHKFGGAGVEPTKVRVCTQCGYGEDESD
ncbi:MAG: hypothetical protein ACQEP1_03005 [Nanobdellota archaeon]